MAIEFKYDVNIEGRADADLLNGTSLNNGFVPYKSSGVNALADTKIYTDSSKVGINTTTLTEMFNVNGYTLADGYKTPGGTSAEFLKADGSVDSSAFINGSGVGGEVGYFSDSDTLTSSNRFTFDDVTNNLTASGTIQGGNLISDDRVTADYYVNIPVMQTSNFAHTSNTALTWYNVPFNSVAESATRGEQHCMVMPYVGRIRKFIMRNTSTGTAPTATTNKFRVLKNGSTIYTSGNTLFGSGLGMYSAWSLTDTAVTFNALDILTIQFQANNLWQDVAATVLFEFY
jgi:hypothetical protein